MQVVENAGANLTVVLPDYVSSSDAGAYELSDTDLEQVAGGEKVKPASNAHLAAFQTAFPTQAGS